MSAMSRPAMRQQRAVHVSSLRQLRYHLCDSTLSPLYRLAEVRRLPSTSTATLLFTQHDSLPGLHQTAPQTTDQNQHKRHCEWSHYSDNSRQSVIRHIRRSQCNVDRQRRGRSSPTTRVCNIPYSSYKILNFNNFSYYFNTCGGVRRRTDSVPHFCD